MAAVTDIPGSAGSRASPFGRQSVPARAVVPAARSQGAEAGLAPRGRPRPNRDRPPWLTCTGTGQDARLSRPALEAAGRGRLRPGWIVVDGALLPARQLGSRLDRAWRL